MDFYFDIMYPNKKGEQNLFETNSEKMSESSSLQNLDETINKQRIEIFCSKLKGFLKIYIDETLAQRTLQSDTSM